MKKKLLFIIAILVVISIMPINKIYGSRVNDDYLDVKIGKTFNSSDYLTLSSKEGFYLYNKSNKNMDIFQIIDSQIIISSNDYGDVDILDVQNNIIKTIPGDGSVIIGSGSINNSIIQIDKKAYRDFMGFIIRANKISLVNHIHIEKYLYGVVPREVSPSFPIESIKAQAVAARTFAMANKNKHKGEGFDLCDTTHCQVYGGVAAENPTTSKAVDETKNIYVYYNGKPADTTFHSNNGGYIECSKDVWGGHLDYLVAKEDPFSANTTASTWSLELTNDEFNNKILSGGVKIGHILDIQILETTQANRVSKLKLIGTLGEEVMTGAKLRTILGNTSMKSTWFDIIKEGESPSQKVYAFDSANSNVVSINLNNAIILDGNSIKSNWENKANKLVGSNGTKSLEDNSTNIKGIRFEGRGYGHGVGMSQYGAAEMARQEYSYEEILKHYYTGVDIIYNGQ